MPNPEGIQPPEKVVDKRVGTQTEQLEDLALRQRALAFIQKEALGAENEVWSQEAHEKKANLDLRAGSDLLVGNYSPLLRHLDTALYQQFVAAITSERLDEIRRLMGDILTAQHVEVLSDDELGQDISLMLTREEYTYGRDEVTQEGLRELRQALHFKDYSTVITAIEEQLSFNEMVLFRLEQVRRLSPDEYAARRAEADDLYGGGTSIEEIQGNLRTLWFSVYKRSNVGGGMPVGTEGVSSRLPELANRHGTHHGESLDRLNDERADVFVEALEAANGLISRPLDVFQEVFARRVEGYKYVQELYEQYLTEQARLEINRPDATATSRSNRAVNIVAASITPDIRSRIEAALTRNAVQATSSGLTGQLTVGTSKLLSDWFACVAEI